MILWQVYYYYITTIPYRQIDNINRQINIQNRYYICAKILLKLTLMEACLDADKMDLYKGSLYIMQYVKHDISPIITDTLISKFLLLCFSFFSTQSANGFAASFKKLNGISAFLTWRYSALSSELSILNFSCSTTSYWFPPSAILVALLRKERSGAAT